jgi:uncharacterized protein (TIGR00730 family)
MKKGYICVFGASSENIDRRYIDVAYSLGKLLAENGWGCVNGAGSHGVMRAVSDGVLDAGGDVHGIIPKFMVDNNWYYNRLVNTTVTRDMHERKSKMAELSSGFIALPGGCGTLEELLEMITWRQLNIIAKPIVIINIDNFFNPLIDMLNSCISQGFMKPSHASLWKLVDTPQEAIDAIDTEIANGVKPAEVKL